MTKPLVSVRRRPSFNDSGWAELANRYHLDPDGVFLATIESFPHGRGDRVKIPNTDIYSPIERWMIVRPSDKSRGFKDLL